jgi:hypothetical protein
MHRTRTRLILVFFAAITLSGCTSIGNEVLVFGTETKVAIDVSADPTGQPSFTVGYKRREAVWLPLSSGRWGLPTHLCVQGVQEQNKMMCEAVGEDQTRGSHVCVAMSNVNKSNAVTKDNLSLLCDSTANVRGHLYQGTSKGDTSDDAYSVMASFGLDTSATGGAKIAQFIATGIAARKITEANGAALVNSQAAVPAMVVQQVIQAQESRLDKIVKAVVITGNVDKTKLEALTAKSKFTVPLKARLNSFSGKTEQEFRDVLWREFASNLEELSGIVEGGI